MRRRDYLVGGAGLVAVFAGGAYVAYGGDSTGESVSSATVRTLEAPGSSDGSVTVPEAGQVTVIEIFEPHCRACQDQFPELASAHEAVGDRARFVSLVPESSEFDHETVVEEWRKLGGNWAVGIDPDDHFFHAFQVTSVPHLGVVDPEGRLVLSRSDVVDAERIERAVLEAAEE